MAIHTHFHPGKAIPGLPCQWEQEPATAEDLYCVIASATRLSKHRLRISTKRDGTGVINIAQQSLELGDTSEIFVKDLGTLV